MIADELTISFRRAVELVADAVPISRFFEDTGATALRRSGAQLVGHCPNGDHEDRTPSFTVWSDRTWHCFGCDFGYGYPRDVVSLHMLLDGHPNMWSAMVDLCMRYGVELPGRSDAWHAAQERRCEYLDCQSEVLGAVLARRLFRVMVLPYVNLIEDDEEREKDLARAWAVWYQHPARWATYAAAIIS